MQNADDAIEAASPVRPSPIRLDLGAGTVVPDGYVALGRDHGSEIYPLAYPDNYADVIRASHVLEHFSHKQVGDVLAEWVRVLKPGGVLKIAVPDFEKVAAGYLQGRGKNCPAELIVMGAQTDANDFHHAIFDRESLRQRLSEAGLVLLRSWKSEIADCADYPISLNLEGTKPAVSELRVSACMSVPRLGFIGNMRCAFEALVPLGVKLRLQGGAFWGQALTRCIEQAVAEDQSDCILTIDYDSVFTKKHVAHLLQLMMAHPEAGAIAALQASRHMPTALFTAKDENGVPRDRIGLVELEPDLMEVHTAHFGLTLIRTSALAAMKRPWFLPVPDKDGRWSDDGKIDEDINFWVNMRESGHRLFLANHVVIGHVEETVRWPGHDLQSIYQPLTEFNRTGAAPEGAWQ